MRKSLGDAVRQFLPGLIPVVRNVRGRARAAFCKIAYRERSKFDCPICGYSGPFIDFKDELHPIRETLCPKCDLYERHRLQVLVMDALSQEYDFASKAVLHFAPEPAVRRLFARRFRAYHTADIAAAEVDFQVDICRMPFPDSSYDIIYASHVLEHVRDDGAALAEIWRVLKPGGFALLPVPVVSPYTIEYPEPNPHEFGHVRAIGTDYFAKYRTIFRDVKVWSSSDFSSRYQLYTIENRDAFPSQESPHRVSMPGTSHPDYVPVCFK